MKRAVWAVLLGLAAGLGGCGGGPAKDAGGELARAWRGVRAEARAVDSLAHAGDLAAARHHARRLHETAALLPALSGAYVSTRQGPLTYALRDMRDLVDSLGVAADQGDTARVWRQAQKLRHTVAYIGGLYPTGLLPGASQTPGGAYARPPEAAEENTAPPPAAPTVTVVCPMHPEETRALPVGSAEVATCARCGMKLVPRAATPPDTMAGARAAAPPHAVPAATPDVPARHMDHRPRHGGQFAMQGDYHLELVARPDGRLDLYVYDAWTKPLPLAGATGELTLEVDEGASGRTEQIVPLRVSRTEVGLMTARVGDLARAAAATARLTLPDTAFAITFPLESAAPPAGR